MEHSELQASDGALLMCGVTGRYASGMREVGFAHLQAFCRLRERISLAAVLLQVKMVYSVQRKRVQAVP